MNARQSTSLLLSLVSFLTLPSRAHAIPVVVDFEGNIYWVTDPATGVVVNDPIEGRIRYETSATPDILSDEQVVYPGSLQELTLDILHEGAVIESFSATGGSTMVVSSAAGQLRYGFFANGNVGLEDESLLGVPIEALTLTLQNIADVPGSTTDLPIQLSMDLFDPALSFISVQVNDNDVLSAYITSLQTVPEPSTFALALLLLPALALCKRRQPTERKPAH